MGVNSLWELALCVSFHLYMLVSLWKSALLVSLIKSVLLVSFIMGVSFICQFHCESRFYMLLLVSTCVNNQLVQIWKSRSTQSCRHLLNNCLEDSTYYVQR